MRCAAGGTQRSRKHRFVAGPAFCNDRAHAHASTATRSASRKPTGVVASASADVAPEVAAEVAATPAVQVPPPVLTGYRESELRALLGPPSGEENRPPGKQWRYRFEKCTLDIQLYPDVETKQYGTLAYKVKSDDDTDEGRRLCLAQLRSRLPAGR